MEKVSFAREARPAGRILSDADAHEIAVEAYTYAYPLVLMEITRRVMTNVATPTSTRAPMNQFAHMREFPDASFTDVVSPNADTLYSILWFDVSEEPLIIHLPDFEGRYHLLPMLDMWADVFASPGTRTTGNQPENFALVGARWRGSLPYSVAEIRTPTEQGWIIGRTQTNGTNDYRTVHRFQAGLISAPLSMMGRAFDQTAARVDTTVTPTAPAEQVADMDAATFFALFSKVTRANPPHPNDYPILARIRRLGLEPGKIFNLMHASDVAARALVAAPAVALKSIEREAVNTGPVVNGWRFLATPIGTYGTDYLHRASIARVGLGANVIEDARYATAAVGEDGRPLDSGTRYTLHFGARQRPPVRAFWSLSVYNERHFFAANPINRFAIGDRDRLKVNEDGSLDIHVQREDPGSETRSNWLPTPLRGVFSLALRMYWPRAEAIDGTWNPPALKRVSA